GTSGAPPRGRGSTAVGRAGGTLPTGGIPGGGPGARSEGGSSRAERVIGPSGARLEREARSSPTWGTRPSSAPDEAGRVHHQLQLGDLLVVGQGVAVHGGGEP